MMRKYILQILLYLLINYKLLKVIIFPFKSTVFTFPIPTICSYRRSSEKCDPFVHGPNRTEFLEICPVYRK